ncbi:Putative Protein phosphatase PP2A regulatory subunit B [Rhizopus microsporus]|nr:Putative Protein phosphatase PP2A regulatory subunit B [Rhizopus microsporus]
MSFYISLLAAYILGGLTLIPLILLSLFMLQPKSLPSTLTPSDKLEEDYKDETMVHSHFYKVGYLQATQNTPIQSRKGRFFKPYATHHPYQHQQQQQNQQPQQPQQNYQCQQQQQQQQQQHFFAVLKFSTLFLYDSDLQQDCKVVINISHVMTGSYNNTFHLYDREGKTDITLQADKSAFRSKRVGAMKNKMSIARNSAASGADNMDFSKKILHASWHPRENTIAIAATNNLFIFTEQ